MTQHYRLLTKEEIARLEAQHCIASDWSGVEVADDFHTDYIHHTRFSGKVRLGVFEKEFTLAGGMAKHSGVYYATLHNVTVGDNCYIENVKNYIANYEIGHDTFIENVDIILVDCHSRFGNGVEVSVLNETGGREVIIHDRLSAHQAYIMALYRHRPVLIEKMRKIIESYAESHASDTGTIGSHVMIVNAGYIKNVRIGDYCQIEGTGRLKNGSINSNEHAPVHIGYGVICDDFIISSGSHVEDGTMLTRCFVGQACHLGHTYSASDSLFFSNCQEENGEACAIFAGPFTVTHHKSTLLIAGMFSFMNAGSGTNQSNHAYKLGPRHHGVLERGCKTASGSHISWPAHIGAFSLVMGHCAPGTDSSEWPFSYLVEQGSSHYVIPGITLRGVGTLRDIGKWPARDGRPPQVPQTDRVSFEAFSPYTMGRVFRARITLEELSGRFDADTQEITWNGLRLKEKSVKQGIEWYRLALDRYLGEQLIRQLETHEGMPSDGLCEALHPRAACSDRWGDIGGMLAPISEINDITRIIATGQLDRIEKLGERLRLIHDRYDDFAWAWTWNLLHEIYPDAYDKDFIPSLCLPVIRKWETAATTLNRQIIADATKDISTGSLAGFGIDGGEETAVDDALAVRGTVQQCGIIQELEKQQTEIKEKAGYWLHKLTL